MLKQEDKFPEDAEYLMEELTGFNYTQLQLHRNDEVPSKIMHQFHDGVVRLGMDEPVQYILGNAYFMGRSFTVTPDVLIPRQETEEMVQRIIDDHNDKKKNILDIGTGSGVIAISLGLTFPDDDVLGTDISEDALKIARLNADNYQANNVFLEQSDLFDNIIPEPFDIIVSNPPYISHKEQSVMDPSVIKYEPDLALYGDEDGLKFYQDISLNADKYLTKDGILYMEFGYHQKSALEDIFAENMPKYKVEFNKDMSGNYRYLKAEKEKI